MKGIKNVLGFMAAMFLCMGLLFVGMSVWQQLGNSRWEAEAVSTEGVYISVGKGNVRISYEAEGQNWVIPSSFQSSFIRVGDPVTVWYQPGNPGSGRITSWITWGLFRVIGGTFALIGLGFLIALLRGVMKRRSLEMNGTRVTAQVVSIDRVYAVRINGQNPYVIRAVCEHPYTRQQMNVKSSYLMNDPTGRIQNGQVTVLVDPMQDKRYYMETDHLQ